MPSVEYMIEFEPPVVEDVMTYLPSPYAILDVSMTYELKSPEFVHVIPSELRIAKFVPLRPPPVPGRSGVATNCPPP